VGRDVTTITEDVLVAYFENVKRRFATSSTWTKYSILNYCDISRYDKKDKNSRAIFEGSIR
jgi:hypothetical protein